MDDARRIDDDPSAPSPDDAAPQRRAVWWDRTRRGARSIGVRSVRLARTVRESYRKHTAWTIASVTGTLGVALMAVLQLLYVLPSTAAPDPRTQEVVTGPQDPGDLLPLMTSTGTAPAGDVRRNNLGTREALRRERPVPEPLELPTPAAERPQSDPLADGGFGDDSDSGFQVVPARKPRPTPMPLEEPADPFGPPFGPPVGLPAPATDNEPIPAEPRPDPMPLPTPAVGPLAPAAPDPLDPLDALFLGGPSSAPKESPFDPPSAEPEPRPAPEPVLNEPPPAAAEDGPPSEPEPITVPQVGPTTGPPVIGNPPVADDPFGPDPLDDLFSPRPQVEPRRTTPPLTAPPVTAPSVTEPQTDAPPLAEPSPAESPWPEPPMREAPAAVEPPPVTDEPDFDPLDALFNGSAGPRPRPEPQPELQPEPHAEPDANPDANAPVGSAAPIAVDVLVLPPDDDAAFRAESSPPRAEPLEPDRRENDPWSVRTERDRVEVPRPYRERLTPVLREQIERERGQAPQPSPVPAEKPSARQLDVVIEKHGPEAVAADVPVKFEIVVRNGGRTPVECVDVDEPVPPTHEVLDVDPPALFDRDTLRWRLHDLEAGESRTLTMVLVPTGRGTIETTTSANVASTISASVDVVPAGAIPVDPSDRPNVVADIEPVTEPPEVSPIDPVSQPLPRPEPDSLEAAGPARLRLEVVMPERVRVGAACPIVFRVTNEGEAAARGVRLREFLPDGLTHPLGERLEYIVGVLPPGATKEARLTVTAADPGTFVNEAALRIAGDAAEPVEPAGPVTSPVTVYEPGFRLRREGWREVTAGRPVEFTNHVENVAGRELRVLVIEETVPAGVEVVRVGDGGRYDETRGTITWRIDRLSADETATLRVTLRAETPGPFRTEVHGEAADQAAMPIAANVTAVRRGR
jgi:hypothetical protein